MKLYAHQEETAEFIASHNATFCTSDPGTGKTIATIEGFIRAKGKRMLILAPLSILKPAWGQDLDTYAPHIPWEIARGPQREGIIKGKTTVIITNHDSVKWLAKMSPDAFKNFDTLVIDESTAFKHHTSQRSKALRKLSTFFERRIALTGTPNSNTVLDLWHQILILDEGTRLGTRFWAFRSEVCHPIQVGAQPNAIKWEDKPHAGDAVASMISDITIRHKFETCIDIPPNVTRTINVTLPAAQRRAYNTLLKTNTLETSTGCVNAIHAGIQVKKLLQLMTGAIYDEAGEVVKIHDERYNLVMQLVEERQKTLVAFNWTHERTALCKLADKLKIPYGVIDGKTPVKTREKVVKEFQEGNIRVIFAHPQSAAHGLTLTAGTTTIWCSPTYNAEHYQQFNRRIYRAGQTQKTETLRIAALDTKETEVYDKLEGKLVRMDDLLNLFTRLTHLKTNAA